MGESKRRKQLDPNYDRVKLLSPEAKQNAEKRLLLQARFAKEWGDYLNPVEYGIIESWEPMEVELACIETGVFDNIPSPFKLSSELDLIAEHISQGEIYQSPFHSQREIIYTAILDDREEIEQAIGFSDDTKEIITSALSVLESLYGYDGAHHKEVWKYVPSDAQDFLDLMEF
jgi:hypothetical protein